MAGAGADDLEARLLAAVASGADIASTWDWAAAEALDHAAVVGTMKSLQVDG
jgi:hypothetical protein